MTSFQGGGSVDQLVIGDSAENSLYDADGRLLIAAGVEITDALVESFRRRGIKTLFGEPSGQVASSAPAKRATRSSSRQDKDDNPIEQDPVFSQLSSSYSARKVQRVREYFASGAKAVNYLSQSIGRSETKNLRRAEVHVENYFNELLDDPDPVVASAIAFDADLQLANRCVQLSVLSMAMAQQAGFNPDRVQKLGSAALVHDWSLFELEPTSRFAHQSMTDEVRARFLAHPETSVRILDMIQYVDPEIKLYVMQVHELLDGTGFPNGLTSDQIDPVSQILSVADAYLTLTAPPKEATRVVPCDAVAFLINAAAKGRYSSSAVRGLLKAVTLYPLGSVVELSDTTKAKVIGTNGLDYGYPIVESMSAATTIINLKESELFVTRPVVSQSNREVRLTEPHGELNAAISKLGNSA